MTSDHELIVVPDKKGLREFGLVTGGLVALLFGVVFPWLLEREWPVWPWIVFALVGGAGLLIPASLKRVYYWWMRFALLLSKITTPIIMGLVYYLVVTPMGLVMTLFGHDAMNRRYDSEKESYRVASNQTGDAKKRLERPF